MKKFTYEARDKATGNIVKSLVQAESESEAAKALTARAICRYQSRRKSRAAG